MTAPKSVFVTGGTGLVGRAVVERLLDMGTSVALMVRPTATQAHESLLSHLKERAQRSGASLSVVEGDLTQDGMGLSSEGRAALGHAEHCFHIGALYDLDAPAERLHDVNVEGTRRLLTALTELQFRGRLHHVSSIAVAGDHQGTFSESMFQEGQKFPHVYHRTKFESERLVRESRLDYRIYRPSSVVGDSKSGAIDKIDGIYFSFGVVQKLAATVPRWVRIPIPRVKGRFNIVPVDYVADAMLAIALSPSESRVFHLVDANPQRFVRMLATLVKAAGGPSLGPAVDFTGLTAIKQAAGMVAMLPAVQELRDAALQDFGLPAGALDAMNIRVRFDDANSQAALRNTGIQCPHFKTYAKNLFRYYEDHLDPATQRPLRYRKALAGKTILITGASRGIGAAAAQMAAASGAKLLLAARGREALEEVAATIREAGGEAYVYPTDLSSLEEVDRLAESVLADHGGVDVLIHNAARSIRRPAVDALDRFHDYERTMALNYFSPVRLTLRLLPSLQERSGTISLVVTMGVLIPSPYFGAYQASKSALDTFGDSLASEMHHDGIHVSSVYLPLVKTEMMAPTEEYAGRVDVMTPERAAQMILDGVADRKRRMITPEGRVFAISNRLVPMTTTRVLNLIRRTFPIGDAPSEFPMEQSLITKAIGGSPI